MPRTPRQNPGARDLWGYLAFSHGWTWLFWAIVIARGTDVWASAASVVLFVLWRWGGGTLTGSTMTDIVPRGSGVGRSKWSLGSQAPGHDNTRRDNS